MNFSHKKAQNNLVMRKNIFRAYLSAAGLAKADRRLEGFAGRQILVTFRGQKERHRLSGALSFMGRQPREAVGVLAHRCVV
jgi:hypothetical protein